MTSHATFAPLSSAAPVGLFYSAGFVQMVGRLPCKQDVGGSTPSPGSNPALTDGGQSSVRNLLSKLPAGARLAGFFE
jgi:hypothetical protein